MRVLQLTQRSNLHNNVCDVRIDVDDAEPKLQPLDDSFSNDFREDGAALVATMTPARVLAVLGALRAGGWRVLSSDVYFKPFDKDYDQLDRFIGIVGAEVRTFIFELDESGGHRTPDRHRRRTVVPAREIEAIDVPSPRPDAASPTKAGPPPVPPAPAPPPAAAPTPPPVPAALKAQLAEAATKDAPADAGDAAAPPTAAFGGGSGRNFMETLREGKRKEAEDKAKMLAAMTPEDREKFLAAEEAADAHDKLKSKHANRLASTFKSSGASLSFRRGGAGGRGGRGRGGRGAAASPSSSFLGGGA
jgi:hypothetical protein